MSALRERIRLNLDQVENKIRNACGAVDRDPQEVKVVLVTKGHPAEVVLAAIDAGVRVFGENYPEETQEKQTQIPLLEGIEWRMIGHLQSRKIPTLIDCFQTFDSLDSLRLARKLNERLIRAGQSLPVLLEMNSAGEASKGGWDISDTRLWRGVLDEIKEITQFEALKLQGLMCMPPMTTQPENVRGYFQLLRRFAETLQQEFGSGFGKELSMGTSQDFEVAVQEGATMVRLGTVILGSRPPRGTN